MSFDKIAAVYVYCMNYSGGMWSREYALLCRIQKQYRLRLTDSAIHAIEDDNSDPDGEWIDARRIYLDLEQGFKERRYHR